MPRPRLVFLGAGGPFSCLCLERLIEVADVAAVVMPKARGRGLGRVLRTLRQRYVTRGLRAIVRRHRIPTVIFGDDLRRFNADLLCTASFPHIVPSDLRAAARLGAINVHSSLLPRHRGPDPIFWTYFDDDRVTGVTVHWMTDRVDDGDVIVQRRIDVARGISGLDLYMQLANEAAEAMASAVAAVGDGSAKRTPQPDAPADPPPSQMTWRIDYEEWPAERIWHFLRGYSFRTGATLADRDGNLHRIGIVERYESKTHDQRPGTFTIDRAALTIYCRDGVVIARAAR
ncbi:MAG: methionyl-tRNA formyltransferase [Acidobacteriota bacterium]|jgi:methionyl-tRNA formyltransferase|nr:methionyl-tRNA formyltransferase [Acidobacteriota bacterium]